MTPRKGTAPAVVDTPPAPPAPEPAVQPSQLAALHRMLRSAEERLTLRLELVRSRLRDARGLLGEELEATRIFTRQHPGSEIAVLTSRASSGLAAVAELTDTVVDARTARETGLALVARVVEQLASLQLTDMFQLEHRDTMQTALVPVKISLGNLAGLLDRSAPILSLGRVCAGRVAQACLTVAREWRVEHMTRRLAMLQLAVETLRTSSEEGELAAVLAAVERQLEARLYVPTIEWPKSGDPFAAPTLRGETA